MNLQQFLSEQPIDQLLHQYFSLQGQSQKTKQQQSTLINSIVLYIASHPTFTFNKLYQQCQYQLQVNNQERDAVNKLCKLITGVVNKASYLMRNIDVKYFVQSVLEFLLSKVFVTLCSADCIRCIWALINAYALTHPLAAQQKLSVGKCSTSKSCCESKNTMKDQNQQQQGCCKGGSTNSSGCCQSSTPQPSSCCQSSTPQPAKNLSSLITSQQKICRMLISKFLITFKLHVKAYPFRVRKDIYKLIHYILKFVKLSQEHFLSFLTQAQRYQRDHFQSAQSTPLFVQIGATKQQLIQLAIKNLSDEKDPRNMQLIFQNYLVLIELFSQEIEVFNHRGEIFQNIEVYYPLSMQGDQDGFQIESEDRFSVGELKQLLDKCLLQELFKNQVRELLIEKMLAPPIHEYASLYVKYITKFNPNTTKLTNIKNSQEELQKYSILTMNLLHRLCGEEYLDQNYQEAHEGGCCSTKKTGPKVHFSIAELISTIIRNVFLSSSSTGTYTTYTYLCEQKLAEFMNALIVTKMFNHSENNKHAGTIIQIVKTILNPDTQLALKPSSPTPKAQPQQSQSGGCCSTDNANEGSCCGGNQSTSQSKECCSKPIQPAQSSPIIRQAYGQRVNFQQMLVNYIVLNFMKFWSAKGDVAFKLGLLIIALNKKHQKISIQQYLHPSSDQSTQNLLQHLLITLGNVYQNHKSSDQIKIMVLKTLMIIAAIMKTLYVNDKELMQKNINKIRKINNSIVHQECIKFSQFLSDSSMGMSEQSDFSRSEQPILKSYVDYLMEMYVSFESSSQLMKEEVGRMMGNIFGSFGGQKEDNDNLVLKQGDIRHYDVKLYAAVRYLSIVSSKEQLVIDNQQVNTLTRVIFSILLSSNQQLVKKLITLLKYYTYPIIVSLFTVIFNQIYRYQQNLNKESLNLFFINVSLIGKLLSEKFQEFHTVELQSGQQPLQEMIMNDIRNKNSTQQTQMKSQQLNYKDNLSESLLWYMLKRIWRRNSWTSETNNNPNPSKLTLCSIKPQHNNLGYKLTIETKQRLFSFTKLYQHSHNLQNLQLNPTETSSDLQCCLIYVKYLKAHNNEKQLRFNSRLAQLYDAGMIEYFWNRLLREMAYSENSIISTETRIELIELIEFLPEKILVVYAEKIAPVIIYTTRETNQEMIEEKQTLKAQKDEFDYTRVELISRLSASLPQQSLIQYVIPYCLHFLKLSAISCQQNTPIPTNIISPEKSIQTILNTNKIVHILVQKSQEREGKNFVFEKLKKSLLQTHKKQFIMYFNRLVYHKKRLIRQSSRSLLMAFE